MKILIIDDSEKLAEKLNDELEKQNYAVDVAISRKEGLELLTRSHYDVVVLDLSAQGLALCKKLKELGKSTVILVLVSKSEEHTKIQCLDAGADDCVVKPFDIDVLSARIRALIRRSVGVRLPKILCGPLVIETASLVVRNGSTIVDLTPTEYRLLLFLALNPSRFFNSEELVVNLWSTNRAPSSAAVKTHMKTLRKKLSNAGVTEKLIESVYGYGYRLKAQL